MTESKFFLNGLEWCVSTMDMKYDRNKYKVLNSKPHLH